ncbi:hypothetical protein GTW78_08635 [Streptomyces sp. SID4948]|nr:hypothetical protein [Streptomyces sp. SID4948]
MNPATVFALRLAGWYPDRHLDVSFDIQSLERQGYISSPGVAEFLESFRGLKIGPASEDGPNFVDGEPFFVDGGVAADIRTNPWRLARPSAARGFPSAGGSAIRMSSCGRTALWPLTRTACGASEARLGRAWTS